MLGEMMLIDDLIDEWHDNPNLTCPLYEHCGLTAEEFQHFVQNRQITMFTEHPKQNNAFDKEVGLYADIGSHCKSYKNFMGNGKTTDAHELCHGVASELRMKRYMNEVGDIWDSIEEPPLDIRRREKEFGSTSLAPEELLDSYELWQPNNRYQSVGAGRINGFYLGNNNAIILQEPNLRKSSAIPYIPSNLRGSRYNLYIKGQTAWDDTPLYIFDEYVAYIMGCATAVDLYERKLSVETNQDHCYGPIEFIIYGSALCQAIEEKDNDYWKSEPKFIPFYTWFLKYAFNTFHKARKIFPWGDADKMFNEFQKGESAKGIRSLLKTRFNFEIPNDVVNIDKLGKDKFRLI